MAAETIKSLRMRPARQAAASLAPVETGLRGLLVPVGGALRRPGSVVEICRWLFISNCPLTMDDLMKRPGLSLAPTVGRRARYEAEAELRTLAARFRHHQLLPNLDSGARRLGPRAGLVKELPPAERPRVTRRQSWVKKGQKLLPMVGKMLGD